MISSDTTINKYKTDGEQVIFSVTYPIYKSTDLKVLLSDGAHAETILLIDTDYTVSINADHSGGLVIMSAPPPSGHILAISLNLPLVQSLDLSSTNTVSTEALETELDKQVQMIQQISDAVNLAVQVPVTSDKTPNQLMDDIFTARDEAQASAEAAAQSATAAEKSAVDAAASENHAKGYQDWSCQCADRAEQARDAALAQAVATNELMAAEVSKINAIVVANKDDQQAAIAGAKAWADSDMPPDPDDPESKSAKAWAKVAEENVTENLPTTSKAKKGVMQVGDNLDVTAQGVVSVPLAEKDKPGVIQPDGANLDIIYGLLNLSERLQAELAEQEFLRKLRIGAPKFHRSTVLPDNHAWPDGSFVEFEDWPEFGEVYEQGGFTGLVMPWNADAATQAANLGKYRPNSANPTGLYLPLHGGQFFRNWVLGQSEGAGAWHRDEIRNIVGSIGLPNDTGPGDDFLTDSLQPLLTSGAIYVPSTTVRGGISNSGGSYTLPSGIAIDASRSVHTGTLNVPPHNWQPVIFYLGLPK